MSRGPGATARLPAWIPRPTAPASRRESHYLASLARLRAWTLRLLAQERGRPIGRARAWERGGRLYASCRTSGGPLHGCREALLHQGVALPRRGSGRFSASGTYAAALAPSVRALDSRPSRGPKQPCIRLRPRTLGMSETRITAAPFVRGGPAAPQHVG